MRVLVTCSLGGAGHLLPVAHVGARLAAGGHAVTVLVPPSLERGARETGLAVEVGAEPPREEVDSIRDRMAAGPPADVAGLVDRELFADRCTAALLPAARELLRDDVDLVVREACEYAGVVAAREAATPFVTVAVSASRLEHDVLAMVAPILEGHGAGTAGAIAAAPFLTAFPAPLDPSPWARTVRYRVDAPAAAPLPDWWPGDARPLVYATLGSVVGHTPLAPRAFATALEAVRDLDARVLVTVGHAFDASALGAVPANVRVEPWVPNADVLAACDLVVCHGGSGTTLGALRAGVPLVVCPLFADNERNGAMVAASGTGLAVRRLDASLDARPDPSRSGELHDAAVRVLADDGFRRAARAVAAACAAAPPADAALLEAVR